MRKMRNVLFRIFETTAALLQVFHLSITKLRALPTAKRKDGNTRSVGVKPCQLACKSGEKVFEPSPGVFTMIMKQMVIPRNTSRAVKRCVLGSISANFKER